MSLNQRLKLHICECGDLHLTYQSMTFHFTQEDFLSFAKHVGRMASHVSNLARPRQPISVNDTPNTNFH